MTDREDINAVAAEYVLGTLDPGERASVAQRRRTEPALEAAIRDWEQRLSPLAETVPAVAPPADMLSRIERQLGLPARTTPNAAQSDGQRPTPLSAPASAARQSQARREGSGNVVDLQRRLSRWRRTAIAASALAAGFALAFVWREVQPAPQQPRYVAVFQKDDASPAFLMTVDLAKRELTVRMVAAEAPPGKTYQLWIAAEPLGRNPRSLGLIDKTEFTVQRAMLARSGEVLRDATFGVSLEPEGGSPTGLPTGPVFHSRLIRLTP
jgi:anti-sigma-K factor RskA